jgi:hypothetical protein
LQYLLDLTLLFFLHLEDTGDLLFAALRGRSFVSLLIAQDNHNRRTSPLPHSASRLLFPCLRTTYMIDEGADVPGRTLPTGRHDGARSRGISVNYDLLMDTLLWSSW